MLGNGRAAPRCCPPPRPAAGPAAWTGGRASLPSATGCGVGWRALPHDFPPKKTVYPFWRAWRVSGDWERSMPCCGSTCACGRAEPPPPAPGSWTARASRRRKGGAPGHDGTGDDGGKKGKRRKRHLVVETTGLVVKALVQAADVPDGVGGQRVLEASAELGQALPRLRPLWVETASQGRCRVGGADAGLDGGRGPPRAAGAGSRQTRSPPRCRAVSRSSHAAGSWKGRSAG
jgi:putative transposase